MDNIVFEGFLYKFKPGLSSNFVKRYVQISERAFRYFKDKASSQNGKPLVAFRKKIIKRASAYSLNKNSYVKPGSRIASSQIENSLFQNMFEIELNEDYEDQLYFREQERAEVAQRSRAISKTQFRNSISNSNFSSN